MKYYVSNGVKIIECAPSEFKLVMVNRPKKNLGKSTYVNANFFASGRQNGERYTLPVNFLVCDYEASGNEEKKLNDLRGYYIGNKYYYDSYPPSGGVPQFCGKVLTTFYIENGKPAISDITAVRETMTYAVSGIPVMLNGRDVIWKTYVHPQGWTGGELYGTYHIFLGLKRGSNTIYLMSWKSNSSNLISSGEGFKKFSAMGFSDVIKLDGGGSEIMKYQGSIKHATGENRQINCIVEVCAQSTSSSGKNPTPSSGNSTGSAQASTKKKNPYTVPTRTIKKGCTGNDVRWVQFQLNSAGFACGVDGSFGPKSVSTLKSYQTARRLEVDGSCGPATRKSLLKE